MDFPVTVGAFDTIWNGDLSIFWGDAFVAKARLTGGNTPPADPPVPVAPTLLAPANAAHPQQPVGFDWSDVAGAASYTIQIDDSSAFTAPLVRDQASVAASFLSAGGLPTTTQFWRVRGVNTAGTPGAWSAVRSFQAQAAPPPTTVTNLDVNPTTVVGSDLSSGTVIVSEAAPDTHSHLALEQQSSDRDRAGERHRSDWRLHGDFLIDPPRSRPPRRWSSPPPTTAPPELEL